VPGTYIAKCRGNVTLQRVVGVPDFKSALSMKVTSLTRVSLGQENLTIVSLAFLISLELIRPQCWPPSVLASRACRANSQIGPAVDEIIVERDCDRLFARVALRTCVVCLVDVSYRLVLDSRNSVKEPIAPDQIFGGWEGAIYIVLPETSDPE